MTPEQLNYHLQLSETKIYLERFGRFDLKMKPPVFDPENPERCLWGMVNWRIRTRLLVAADREIKMFGQPFDRLDIALIKAILKQEEEYAGL
jgi:hypothetical protein